MNKYTSQRSENKSQKIPAKVLETLMRSASTTSNPKFLPSACYTEGYDKVNPFERGAVGAKHAPKYNILIGDRVKEKLPVSEPSSVNAYYRALIEEMEIRHRMEIKKAQLQIDHLEKDNSKLRLEYELLQEMAFGMENINEENRAPLKLKDSPAEALRTRVTAPNNYR